MKEIEVSAFAKINLTLDVLGRLPDGYHEMSMIMQAVDLTDELRISLTDGEISTITDKAYLPTDMSNLASRAAKAFFDAIGENNCGAQISIKKRIPSCAGLAGGSSDAAAVLRGLNELTGAGFDAAKLMEISHSIGSDVAFCVCGGTALAEGKGEVLTSIDDIPEAYVLICKPGFPVSTPELFGKIDSCRINQRPDTAGMLEAIKSGDITGIGRRCFNVFEAVLPIRERRIIDSIKDSMFGAGALGSSMTGTGSAVYGLFDDINKAQELSETLMRDYNECFVVRPMKKVL